MLNLEFIHRSLSEEFTQSPELVWRTCLRQVSFAPQQDLLPTDKSFSGVEALQFLCEVLCGLHSPVFGETEVFSQFKQFIGQIPEGHFFKKDPRLIEILFSTTRTVRQKYLTLAGELSYGQILRQRLKGKERIVLWGFGLLGKELSQWLQKYDLLIVARDLRKVSPGLKATTDFSQPWACDSRRNCHVIAANIEDQKVLQLARDSQTELIYDLRSEAHLDDNKIINLQMFLNEIDLLKQEQKKVLPRCQEMIRQHLLVAMKENGATHAI